MLQIKKIIALAFSAMLLSGSVSEAKQIPATDQLHMKSSKRDIREQQNKFEIRFSRHRLGPVVAIANIIPGGPGILKSDLMSVPLLNLSAQKAVEVWGNPILSKSESLGEKKTFELFGEIHNQNPKKYKLEANFIEDKLVSYTLFGNDICNPQQLTAEEDKVNRNLMPRDSIPNIAPLGLR